ncbi:hypothetical protein [Nannocystis radixulma]|uniref:STAS/SEC14 domain-containing protein n=1 Tax=Nannocystis radixulma TaxID=2995305 RepID=A0ABT5B162_9BACT|nr:hypothetical protein [Nannocystis radixulma]MDC0667826.1 hypothetical protein [Nannocystis radixulma]
MPTTTSGEYQLTREGDLAHLKLRGLFDLEVATAVHELLAQLHHELGRSYVLCDLTQFTGIPADARRQVGEWNKTHKVSGGAIYGANFAMRTLATLVLQAVRLVGNKVDIEFVPDEATARRWIEAHRAKLLASTGGPHVHQ